MEPRRWNNFPDFLFNDWPVLHARGFCVWHLRVPPRWQFSSGCVIDRQMPQVLKELVAGQVSRGPIRQRFFGQEDSENFERVTGGCKGVISLQHPL